MGHASDGAVVVGRSDLGRLRIIRCSFGPSQLFCILFENLEVCRFKEGSVNLNCSSLCLPFHCNNFSFVAANYDNLTAPLASIECDPSLALEVGVVGDADVGYLQAEHRPALAAHDAVPREPRDGSVVA